MARKIKADSNYSGEIQVGGYTLPTIDGGSGEVIRTDGAGDATWEQIAIGNMADIATGTVIGNMTGSASQPSEVDVSTDLAISALTTELATAESIKTYVDTNSGTSLITDPDPRLDNSLDALGENGNNFNNITFEAEYDNGNSGSSFDIDLRHGQKQKITMTDNCTVTLIPPSNGIGTFLLKVVQDGTGSRTISFPPAVKVQAGVSIVLSTLPNSEDIINIYYDGANYYLMASLAFL